MADDETTFKPSNEEEGVFTYFSFTGPDGDLYLSGSITEDRVMSLKELDRFMMNRLHRVLSNRLEQEFLSGKEG